MRRQQAAAASASKALVTPATPPAEDEEVDMQTTPTAPTSLPPVTPSRHVATAAAKARDVAPPGQPRKTPASKRLAEDSDDEAEDDELPALGKAPVRQRPKVSKTSASRGITASEQRPTRVTRSTAGASLIRKAGGNAVTTPASPVKSSGQGPNKIPRLAATKTTSAAKALAAASAATRKAPQPVSTRRPNPPPSPVPSRLPTLIPSKRPHPTHSTSLSEVAGVPTLKRPGEPDAWMKTNASAVVTPATTSGRPGLRSVRRRRSSFSSADVVI